MISVLHLSENKSKSMHARRPYQPPSKAMDKHIFVAQVAYFDTQFCSIIELNITKVSFSMPSFLTGKLQHLSYFLILDNINPSGS